MRLWLDDTRYPPDDSWDWVRTAAQAREEIDGQEVEEVSLDHDLGYGELPMTDTYDQYAYDHGLESGSLGCGRLNSGLISLAYTQLTHTRTTTCVR